MITVVRMADNVVPEGKGAVPQELARPKGEQRNSVHPEAFKIYGHCIFYNAKLSTQMAAIDAHV